ncbi:hypothetical protein SJ05684_c20950 [Sinorhizobium sojae CCBAU 05684]|uniref:Uncharacterized protein n=1 Tax=Sinorhizobium sojae CCBAU 05684 TaxID=716928 RepID=A0A249PCI3_9HYPH|nr:hypothetical protein SJ05684_c20950 [Sinorhizobium sojae CCBAU 05684]
MTGALSLGASCSQVESPPLQKCGKTFGWSGMAQLRERIPLQRPARRIGRPGAQSSITHCRKFAAVQRNGEVILLDNMASKGRRPFVPCECLRDVLGDIPPRAPHPAAATFCRLAGRRGNAAPRYIPSPLLPKQVGISNCSVGKTRDRGTPRPLAPLAGRGLG